MNSYFGWFSNRILVRIERSPNTSHQFSLSTKVNKRLLYSQLQFRWFPRLNYQILQEVENWKLRQVKPKELNDLIHKLTGR